MLLSCGCLWCLEYCDDGLSRISHLGLGLWYIPVILAPVDEVGEYISKVNPDKDRGPYLEKKKPKN
jgi:hypothetical protein